MTDENHRPPVVLSRDEPYSQIWTTPISRLAAQYGITGTGLAKICARLNVPARRAATGPKKPPTNQWCNTDYRSPRLTRL